MNSFAPIDPRLLDVVLRNHDGYPVEFEAEDTTDAVRGACGDASRDFPESMWIEPRRWAEFAREVDRNRTWPVNYIDRYTNQSPTHECTTHSLITNGTGARNRSRGIIFSDGPKKGFRYPESAEFGSVWLSPLSVYAEANPRARGGANVRRVLEIACERGILPEPMQPAEYGFKHTLIGTAGKGNSNQSSGKWVSLGQFPDGWRETAALFKPLEVIFPESWEQAICLILNGLFVSVGRNGHAIPWGSLVFEGNNLKAAGYPDSYDLTRYDSLRTIKSAWQGAFAIATMTTPDDWHKPAA